MKERNSKRKRGVILTPNGWEKLIDARERREREHNGGNRYRVEDLSEITGLAPNTLTKILVSNSVVDRSTLLRCFRAFDRVLSPQDYKYPFADSISIGQ